MKNEKPFFFTLLFAILIILTSQQADSFTCTLSGLTLTCQEPKNATFIDSVKSVSFIKNSPPQVIIHGTEYQINENGKIFAQVSNMGQAVNNASCKADIINPNSTFFIDNSPMLYLNNSDGLFYIPVVIPNITGLYMISASCSFEISRLTFYNPDEFPNLNNELNDTIISGTATGAVLNLNSFDDNLYQKYATTVIGASKNLNVTYEADLDDAGIINISNFKEINIFFFGQSDGTNTLEFRIFNFALNNFEILPNSLTFSGTATSLAPSVIDDFKSNSISSNASNYINAQNKIRIKLFTSTGAFTRTMWFNSLNIKVLANSENVVDVKGSSELHVTSFLNDIQASIISFVSDLLVQHSITQAKIKEANDTLNQLEIKLDDINASVNILNNITFNPLINITSNITFSQINETGKLEIGKCTQNLSQTLMLWLFVAISLALLILAFYYQNAIMGIFGGLCLFISAIYISPCGIGFGIIIGGLGIILMLIFAFLAWKK